MGNNNIYLVSVYADIKLTHLPEALDRLLVEKRDHGVVLAMDANAHSPMWGSAESNPRGNMAEEFVFRYGLTICNKGCRPTFVAQGSETIIDVTLCSGNMVGNIKRWRVDPEDHMSDHKRITFNPNR